MKRFLSIVYILCLLLSLCAAGASAEAPQFDSGVSELTGAVLGNAADLVQVDGGLLNRGYFEDKYQITFWPSDGGDREAFADDMGKPVPACGAVVYQGQTDESSYGWMLQKIGEMPVILPISEWDAAFYADEGFIWYYTDVSEGEHTVGRVGYDGANATELGSVTGQVICMMPDDQVLLFNHEQNQVQLWKDGSYQTVYSPEEQIINVFSLGESIWVALDDSFGPLSEGVMTVRFPGSIIAKASCANHFALLVSPEAASEYLAVLLFNEAYQAYTTAGTIRRQEGMSIELQPNQMIVRGAEDSITYSYPGPEKWLPYGHHDLQ